MKFGWFVWRLGGRRHVAGCFMCRQPQQKSGSRQPRASQHQHRTEAPGPQAPGLQDFLKSTLNNKSVATLHSVEDIFNFCRRNFDAGKIERTRDEISAGEYFFKLNPLNIVVNYSRSFLWRSFFVCVSAKLGLTDELVALLAGFKVPSCFGGLSQL